MLPFKNNLAKYEKIKQELHKLKTELRHTPEITTPLLGTIEFTLHLDRDQSIPNDEQKRQEEFNKQQVSNRFVLDPENLPREWVVARSGRYPGDHNGHATVSIQGEEDHVKIFIQAFDALQKRQNGE